MHYDTYVERYKVGIRQRKMMRHLFSNGNPSPMAQFYWDMEDQNDEIMLRFYEQLDAKIAAEKKAKEQPEPLQIKITCEVKVKP